MAVTGTVSTRLAGISSLYTGGVGVLSGYCYQWFTISHSTDTIQSPVDRIILYIILCRISCHSAVKHRCYKPCLHLLSSRVMLHAASWWFLLGGLTYLQHCLCIDYAQYAGLEAPVPRWARHTSRPSSGALYNMQAVSLIGLWNNVPVAPRLIQHPSCRHVAVDVAAGSLEGQLSPQREIVAGFWLCSCQGEWL